MGSVTSAGRRRHPLERAPASETEALLAAFHATRDPCLRDRLVERHLPLVRSLARRYAHRGERLEDLVQVGAIGLVEAIDRFDPDRGVAFLGFAVPTITGEIRNHLRDRAAAVRAPRKVCELTAHVNARWASLAARLCRSPTVSELASDAGLSLDDVAEAMQAQLLRAPLSLSAPDAAELDGVAATDSFGPVDDRLLLATGFRTLPRRERRILHLRFFGGLSQAEIAREVGLSQIQVSRLIRASLLRLRGTLDPAAAPAVASSAEAGPS